MDDEEKLEEQLKAPYDPGSEDYSESDLMNIFEEADWQSWDDILDYLRKKGKEDMNLDPEEFAYLFDDVQRALDCKIEFTKDYREGYRLLHEGRQK